MEYAGSRIPLTETLVDYLKPKVLLLVLDNCGHLLPACAQLADALLRSCPNLRILARMSSLKLNLGEMVLPARK